MSILPSVKVFLSDPGLHVCRQQSSKLARQLTCYELPLNCCDLGVPRQKKSQGCPETELQSCGRAEVRDKQRTARQASHRTIRQYAQVLSLAVGRFALLEKLHGAKILDLPLHTSLDPDIPLLGTKFSNICSKNTFTNYFILKC